MGKLNFQTSQHKADMNVKKNLLTESPTTCIVNDMTSKSDLCEK